MAEFLFADLRGDIAPDAPGINDPAITRCGRMAARYFCQETDFLRHEPAAIDIAAAQHTYTIPADPPPLSRPILHALEVWVGNVQIAPRASDQLDREQDSPRENQPWSAGHNSLTFNTMQRPWRLLEEYPPQFYFQERPNTVRLVGIPDESVTGALRIVASIQPAFNAESVDEYIVQQWFDTLVMGTKAYALQMRQKPWTNVQEGLLLEGKFKDMVATAVAQSVSGFVDSDHEIGHVRAYP